MKMKYDYALFEEDNIEDFENGIKGMINNDWSLLGSPFMSCTKLGAEMYCQALTKVIKEKNAPEELDVSCVTCGEYIPKEKETWVFNNLEPLCKRCYEFIDDLKVKPPTDGPIKCHYCGKEIFGEVYLSNYKREKFCNLRCFNMEDS
jgi:hypothetical protein